MPDSAVRRQTECSRLANDVTSSENDTTLATSWPATEAARVGVEFGTDWTGAPGQAPIERFSAAKVQSLALSVAHLRVRMQLLTTALDSHHSPQTDKLPMSETASSAVTSLKAMRISVATVGWVKPVVKEWAGEALEDEGHRVERLTERSTSSEDSAELAASLHRRRQ